MPLRNIPLPALDLNSLPLDPSRNDDFPSRWCLPLPAPDFSPEAELDRVLDLPPLSVLLPAAAREDRGQLTSVGEVNRKSVRTPYATCRMPAPDRLSNRNAQEMPLDEWPDRRVRVLSTRTQGVKIAVGPNQLSVDTDLRLST